MAGVETAASAQAVAPASEARTIIDAALPPSRVSTQCAAASGMENPDRAAELWEYSAVSHHSAREQHAALCVRRGQLLRQPEVGEDLRHHEPGDVDDRAVAQREDLQ